MIFKFLPNRALYLAIFILLNTFLQSQELHFKLSEQVFKGSRTYQAKSIDIDLDGDQDLILANMGLNYSQILLNDGTGYFTSSDELLTQQGHGIGLGDLDNDGDIDLVMTCAGWGQNGIQYKKPTRIYFNDGAAHFTKKSITLPDSIMSGNDLNLIDIDNDGDLDIHIVYYQKGDRIYLNDGHGKFDSFKESFTENCAFGDFNQDGYIDLFISEANIGFEIQFNDGDGNFKSHQFISDTAIGRIFKTIGDVDKDGDLDIIISNGDRTKNTATRILLNNGKGAFDFSDQNLDFVTMGRVGLGDLNMDGKPELIITEFRKPTKIWINTGNGRFQKSETTLQHKGAWRLPIITDINSDGKNDIIIPNFFGGPNEIWIYSKK